MGSRFNRWFGPSGVIALVALVFAMTGGAVGANQYFKSPDSRHRAKPKRGPRGPQGLPGKQGPQGPSGQSIRGPAGPEGPQGAEGSPWVAGGALPSGKTESGTWIAATVGKEIEPGKAEGAAAISFGIRLLIPPEVFMVAEGKEGKEHAAECPGSLALPRAAKGDLCLYVAENQGLELDESFPFVSGALIKLKGPPGGAAAGTWAVTAP